MINKLIKKENEIIVQIQKQLIEGNKSKDIIDFIQKEYKVKNVEILFNQALAMIAEYAQADKDFLKGFAIVASKELYRKMIEVGDFSGALAAIKEFSKLNNLYERTGTLNKPAPGKLSLKEGSIDV